MNNKEEQYFDLLTKDRAESAAMLDKPSMRGIKNSVVEKYSDQAHFIYELLQNADDAIATTARFVLEPDRLIFAHNGKRHFSVSDPETEASDSESGALGDINSITSIANSSKTGASIGKFGVGFKAVFQYTATPHVFDPNVCFRIDRFIVPTLLYSDFPDRKADETLFVFPFDHPEKSATEAYADIAEKLIKLSYPLLFLNNLEDIELKIGNTLGLYGKKVIESFIADNTIIKKICLTQNHDNSFEDQNLWLFSRKEENSRDYSVGYFLDNNNDLIPISEPAFCFFPTKEFTGLKFIIHAPFLLTDSREGIRAGIEYNDNLINQLSILAADSLVYLRDIGIRDNHRLITDSILTIVPTTTSAFSDPKDKNKISFLPFYRAIANKFAKSGLLPTSDGGYVERSHAFWASVKQLTKLFSDNQLCQMTGGEDDRWVFTTIGGDETKKTNRELYNYILDLVNMDIDENGLLIGKTRTLIDGRTGVKTATGVSGISAKFIENQSYEWLNEFYKWLSEAKSRTDSVKCKPIFIDKSGKAVPAYDESNQLILFLPVENIDGYTVVNSALLEMPCSANFIKEMGIKEPSLKDRIYNKIIPLYKNGNATNHDKYFETFFEYYRLCSNTDAHNFVDLVKSFNFISCYTIKTSEHNYGSANSMYFPTEENLCFLQTSPDSKYIDIEKYNSQFGDSDYLNRFLCDLGVRTHVAIISVPLNGDEFHVPHPSRAKKALWTERRIDGCRELISYTVIHRDEKKSVVLWDELLGIIERNCNNSSSLDDLLSGSCEYYYRSPKKIDFLSSDALELKNKAWLCDTAGNFVAPKELTRKTISKSYNTSNSSVEILFKFLGIAEPAEDDSLSEEQKRVNALANKIADLGFDENDIDEFILFKRKKDKHNSFEQHHEQPTISVLGDQENVIPEIPIATKNSPVLKVINDIAQRTELYPSAFSTHSNSEDVDQDEYIPSVVDYNKKIEDLKQKSATEISRIIQEEVLVNKAISLNKYSFGWFKTLLEIEQLNNCNKESASKEISIIFSKVEREEGTQRTLVLKHPDRSIPQFMEDISDIPLVLHIGNTTKTIPIEVSSILSYSLRVKVKNSQELDGLDFSAIIYASIDAQSPSFLLSELQKQFSAFDFPDNYDMQKNLCENIEFVFGPPGTGKTTYLVRNVILPLVYQNRTCRILVLTPTNKAADVITKKIIDQYSSDSSYQEWLVRFGLTGDESIERDPIFKDKTYDIRNALRNVTITTMARFPYDFFMPSGARIFLNSIDWDYIIVDEASMIPLINTVYLLYKKSPKRFFISGDPFQIEPIASVDLWNNENIYSMVHLDSFTTPNTVPYNYKTNLLTTQYRSVPEIGEIFSNLAYGGVLKHHRSSFDHKKIQTSINLCPLNIIRYPTSRYESIYKSKRLSHSSCYQIYSALFVYKYVHYLSEDISRYNPDISVSIGIIAPYKAQANMIDKLISSQVSQSNVKITVGTIHGFQGDECDIIFAVFNTPPTISDSPKLFLNKRNILNVAISRAKDYLFVVLPDNDTENLPKLLLLNSIIDSIKKSPKHQELSAKALEQTLFGSSNYLENNTFSTGHQSVNVYGSPEKRYEIRTEDSAIDIQIHE